jgi:hypothetical protein
MTKTAKVIPLQPGRPAPLTCGGCGGVVDDWVWLDDEFAWENDFEWWRHPASGHDFLCSRGCWVKVHQAHCGSGVPCRG